MQNVLHIEDKVLAPAQLLVHAEMIVLHDVAAEKLVPDDAVIVVGRAFCHAGCKFLPREQAFFVNRTFSGGPPVHDAVKIGNHEIRPVCLGGVKKERRRLRRDPIVGVEELEIVAGRERERLIPCVRDTAVFLVNHADAGIFRRIGVTKCRRAVLAAVVHDEHLKVRKSLREHAVQAARENLFGIVDGNDNRNFRHSHLPPEKQKNAGFYLSVYLFSRQCASHFLGLLEIKSGSPSYEHCLNARFPLYWGTSARYAAFSPRKKEGFIL